MDTDRVHPETRSGDPFYAAASFAGSYDHDDEHPHACVDGVVYIGYEEGGGEHVTVMQCQRCKQAK